MKIAIQGQAGSFHDRARKKIDEGSQLIVCDNFTDVFEAVANRTADKGIVAIENSLYGSINEIYDLLLSYGYWISAETYLHIALSLVGLKTAELDKIKKVISHPIALSEAETYLRKNLQGAELEPFSDTAGAIREVAELNDPTIVAVGSSDVAKQNGLVALAKNIENQKENYTRFVVIDRNKIDNPKANKTSIILELPERPGVLYEALGLFVQRNINLTKLESRPKPGKAWEYMFYIDFEASLNNALGVLDDLSVRGSSVKVLGSYEKADRFET